MGKGACTSALVHTGEVSAQKQPFPTLWTSLEDSALVQFIMLTRLHAVWPAEKGFRYWDSAAKHVHSRSGSSVQYTGRPIMLNAYAHVVHLSHTLSFLAVAINNNKMVAITATG